jgi:predicted MFS family arabinose efflux permease
MDTRGRERKLIVWPMLVSIASVALLLPSWGLVPVVISLALYGLLSGPLDVALFTVRQRRTDPAWMGRAFAVSMSLNFAGFPIGSAIGGFLSAQSIELAVAVAIAFTAAGGLLGWWLIPARAPEPGAGPAHAAET